MKLGVSGALFGLVLILSCNNVFSSVNRIDVEGPLVDLLYAEFDDPNQTGVPAAHGLDTAGFDAVFDIDTELQPELMVATWGWVPYGNPTDRCWHQGTYGPCGERPEFVYVCKMTRHGGITLWLPIKLARWLIHRFPNRFFRGKCVPDMSSEHKPKQW